MEQEFEFIKGYENLYMINRNGEIKSCGKDIIMKPQETDDGYLWVKLQKYVNGEKERKKCRIHRLLGIQYLDNPDNKPEIDHIDRNRQNNKLENLRWVDRIENRRNREDIIENLTEEQQKERLDKIREYKKIWAEKNRRDKGCKIKAEMNLTKDPHYYATKTRERRSKLTSEQKEEHLKKRRENRKPLTEEQKEKARERARKQRENQRVNKV